MVFFVVSIFHLLIQPSTIHPFLVYGHWQILYLYSSLYSSLSLNCVFMWLHNVLFNILLTILLSIHSSIHVFIHASIDPFIASFMHLLKQYTCPLSQIWTDVFVWSCWNEYESIVGRNCELILLNWSNRICLLVTFSWLGIS